MHRDEDDDDDEDPNLAFEMEQQQQLISKQDNTLDLIGSTLNSLKRQAGTLGQEIGEQVELIGALDTEVDTSQSKLSRAMGRMDELVRRSDDRMGGWCVWLLVLVSDGIIVGEFRYDRVVFICDVLYLCSSSLFFYLLQS
jgi:t-SNARE syntaxin family protein